MIEEVATFVLLSVIAFATAAFSAIVGMGGGITLLGAMALVLPPVDVIPIHGVVQLASNSTRTVAYFQHASWRLLAPYAIGLIVGVAIVTSLWSGGQIPGFKPFIGCFLLIFLVWRRYKPVLRNLPLWSYGPLGAVAGGLTLFVGATGPFIAPFFLRDDLTKEQVVATKAACQSVGHFLKLPAFAALGYAFVDRWPLLLGMSVAVIFGTFAGKQLQKHLSEAQFVQLFEIVLTAIAVLLVADGLWR